MEYVLDKILYFLRRLIAMNDTTPLISVVIPTYNRKEKLIRLLGSILRSDYPDNKIEIIVVDDASIDGTYKEVRRRFVSTSN